MHLAIDIFVIYAVWRWGNWRNWKEYHSTMLFLAFANMLYNFMTADYRLWVMKPDILINFKITEILYTVIILTGTTLIFLSRYPANSIKEQIIYNLKWIAIYIGLEWILYKTGRIVYSHGWSLFWSLIFDCIMFTSLYLHYKKPLMAYLLFILITVAAILYFNIPITTPWND